jgi:hypothetical protein
MQNNKVKILFFPNYMIFTMKNKGNIQENIRILSLLTKQIILISVL